jgi:hypothetical protein
MASMYGNNDLSAAELFRQRLSYKEYGYSAPVTPFDLWYNKPLYGRVGVDGSVVYPRENYLTRLESNTAKNIFVLNFVADAFSDFRKNYIFMQPYDVAGTVFESLVPVKGYYNPILRWKSYAGNIYDTFVGEYLEVANRKNKIISFGDYLTAFDKYMEEFGSITPITLTNYLTSTLISPLISGIMIELSSANHADDMTKELFYMEQNCFDCYTSVAQKFGFKIDKNAPWRLIADLNSPAMQGYMEKSGVSFLNLYDISYTKTHETDMSHIKEFLYESYRTYVESNPDIFIYEYYGKCHRTLTKTITREVLFEDKFLDQYPDSFWVGYYVKMLANEQPGVLTSKEVNDLIFQSVSLAKNEELNQARSIIYNTFNKFTLT